MSDFHGRRKPRVERIGARRMLFPIARPALPLATVEREA
jgi:hypothetical protein